MIRSWKFKWMLEAQKLSNIEVWFWKKKNQWSALGLQMIFSLYWRNVCRKNKQTNKQKITRTIAWSHLLVNSLWETFCKCIKVFTSRRALVYGGVLEGCTYLNCLIKTNLECMDLWTWLPGKSPVCYTNIRV